MPSHSELLAEAMNKTTRSGAKISRIRSSNGAEVGGTEFDPRVSRDRIKHYNSRQLESYIRKQDKFLQRHIQFLPLYGGAPLPMNEWKQYQRAEREVNKQRAGKLAEVSDIVLPGQKAEKWRKPKTIGDLAAEQGQSKLQYFESTDSMTKPVKQENVTFTSRESVAKMRDFLKKQRTTSWQAEAGARSDYSATSMLGYLGSDTLNKKMEALSPDQLDTLWNYTSFAANLSLWYSEAKMKDQGKDYNDDILSAQGDDVSMWLDWAGTL